MRKALRIFAAILVLAATACWLAAGANRGWTKTSVPVKTVDEVTGLDLKDKLSQRVPGKQGDLLVVRTSFSIQRSDFNLNAHENEDKVSDTIELTLGIAGAAAR